MNPFDHIIAEARTWVGNWDFVEIEEISWKAQNTFAGRAFGGLWWPPAGGIKNARITLMWPADMGYLWHEVFHSAAANAPLMRHDGSWGEGWCCAFSEVMRQEFSPFPVSTCDPTPGNDLQRLYNWPCTLLVEHVERQADILRSFWLRCNEKARVYTPNEFSRRMGYDPKTGKTI